MLLQQSGSEQSGKHTNRRAYNSMYWMHATQECITHQECLVKLGNQGDGTRARVCITPEMQVALDNTEDQSKKLEWSTVKTQVGFIEVRGTLGFMKAAVAPAATTGPTMEASENEEEGTAEREAQSTPTRARNRPYAPTGPLGTPAEFARLKINDTVVVWWDTPVHAWVPGNVLEDGLRRQEIYVAFQDGNYAIQNDFKWYQLHD